MSAQVVSLAGCWMCDAVVTPGSFQRQAQSRHAACCRQPPASPAQWSGLLRTLGPLTVSTETRATRSAVQYPAGFGRCMHHRLDAF